MNAVNRPGSSPDDLYRPHSDFASVNAALIIHPILTCNTESALTTGFLFPRNHGMVKIRLRKTGASVKPQAIDVSPRRGQIEGDRRGAISLR
ncbi:MAG: hypothetical protein KAH44_17780, partial [Oricola sp.]|nr:hypothetical protein [Oricola sp.]